MKRIAVWTGVFLLCVLAAQAQVPTSRQIPFNNVATTIAPSTPGQALTIQLWDAAATPPGTLLFSEAQTLDVDATGAISFVFGSQTVNGLDPANFPSGASRFLDVVDATGASVLPPASGRIALNAVAFALSPGPQGPQGVPGSQGPPGVVQAVSPGDASIVVAGTPANPTVAVAANGITNANVANGALSAAKIAGTAATLGSNMFSGDQSITGSVGITGNLTMVNSTATAGNLVKGGVLFLHNFGVNNTFLGQNAGNLTNPGFNNSAIGIHALQNIAGSSENTASGSFALFSNTTGNGNTASGAFALQANTIGNNNTATGDGALNLNTTGLQNTASGANALRGNTTGSNNTASGFQALGNIFTTHVGNNNTASGAFALQNNVFGGGNTASGANALQSNITGGGNTASGANALQGNTSGAGNTASGFNSLSSNTTGGNNTAIGAAALQNNTTGSNNTVLGFLADVPFGMGNLTNATAIGAGAIVDASNKIRLGNAAVTLVETSGNIKANGQFAVTSQAGTADMVQRGKALKNVGGCMTITFPVAFSAVPNVVVSSHWDGVGGAIGAVEVIDTISTTGFTECSVNNAPTYFVQWIAIGPR